MDLAAALTHYAVPSLFPALLFMVSLLGVFGQGKRTTDAVLQIVASSGRNRRSTPYGRLSSSWSTCHQPVSRWRSVWPARCGRHRVATSRDRAPMKFAATGRTPSDQIRQGQAHRTLVDDEDTGRNLGSRNRSAEVSTVPGRMP